MEKKKIKKEKIRKNNNSLVIGVYNVYNRKNPFSIYFSQGKKVASESFVPGQVTRLSIIGSFVPSITYNFKFLMKNFLKFISLIIFISCEEIIYPDLESKTPILVVDAWLNNQNESQTIILSSSQDYLDSTSTKFIDGANVYIVNDNGDKFNFTEKDKGKYIWNPDSNFSNLGDVGTEFFLNISYNGKK